jgi:hypothetical protein
MPAQREAHPLTSDGTKPRRSGSELARQYRETWPKPPLACNSHRYIAWHNRRPATDGYAASSTGQDCLMRH